MSKQGEKEKFCLSRWRLTFENLMKVMNPGKYSHVEYFTCYLKGIHSSG